MKVLITGVAGFIGSHTADKFIKEGHKVSGIDDFSTGTNKNIPQDVKFYCYDITDINIMGEVIAEEKPDAIIHLAAQPSLLESERYPEFDATVNVIGTVNLLKIAKDLHIKRFVFSSTSAVYSTQDTREDTLDLFPNNPYGISKLTAERYVKALLPEVGIVLRYANVFGPRQVALGENQLVPRVLDHIYRKKPFVVNGDGQQTRDFIYVQDVANANYIAATCEIPDEVAFNISLGQSYSVNHIVEEIAKLTAYTGEIQRGPEIKNERKQVVMPNDLAAEDLKWEPEFSLHEGLKRTVNSYVK